MKRRKLIAIPLALAMLACGLLGPVPSAEPTASPPTSFPPTLTASLVPAHPETILVWTPANGSRLVGAVHVEGEAEPTFEQTLVVQVVALDQEPFEVLGQQPVIIDADAGRRGAFKADLAFDLAGAAERPGAVNVFSVSPRDGGVTHLTSVQVTLAASGAEAVLANNSVDERIAIFAPAAGDALAGGVAHVEGFALASFEQTLLVEILDVDGLVIGSMPVLVQAPDMGIPGPFAVDVPYTLATPGPGRIVVRDISPAFGQDVHLGSIDVDLEP
ncbi:MAG: hypothetical protein A2Z17_06985 [Gammaproteobacteria bacterium RBG_16_66_13]|nr:MAG: hypothetical protein A2Z17_06985 [Gammaproteobacteria bacterium RBG_16_66_13]